MPRILCIGDKENNLSLAKFYFGKVEIVDGFNDISWFDVLLRRIRLVSIPKKKQRLNPYQKD